MKLIKDMGQRIQRRIHVKGNGCHGWYGSTDSSGYPTCGGAGNNIKVHRWLFAKANPEIDITGFRVVQTCQDKGCLNVEHMCRMTPGETMAFRGGHRSKRINWDLVRRIRRMPKGANMSQVARDNGIAPSTARLIRSNQAWRE